MADEALIDAIYEAAVVADGWPGLLDRLARLHGAKGGLLAAACHDGQRWVASPNVVPLYQDFVAAGWHTQNDRVRIGAARRHPGFLTDTDIYTESEIARLPIYAEFLAPRGFASLAATFFPGLDQDEIALSVEGFESHAAARAAVPALDLLRPHLARASMLAARLGLERARVAVAALEQVGLPAAMLGVGRRLLAANSFFDTWLERFCHDTPEGLRLTDKAADAKLGDSLEALRVGRGSGASLPLRPAATETRAVLHVVPIRGAGRDIFFNATAMVIFATPNAKTTPSVELIQGLLDLTPAEARLARHVASGLTLDEASRAAGVTPHTGRTHLKRIFAKTGLSRQSDLVSLLLSVAPLAGG